MKEKIDHISKRQVSSEYHPRDLYHPIDQEEKAIVDELSNECGIDNCISEKEVIKSRLVAVGRPFSIDLDMTLYSGENDVNVYPQSKDNSYFTPPKDACAYIFGGMTYYDCRDSFISVCVAVQFYKKGNKE